MRHLNAARLEYSAALQDSDIPRADAARNHWRTARCDSTWVAFQSGCLCGLWRAAWLYLGDRL
eukprot:9168535-Heterocapsa_arctica.AAC.1